MQSTGLKSEEFFKLIQAYLATGEGKDLVQKVNGIFQMDLLDKKGGKVVRSYTIDLKNGSGSCSEGPNEKNNALFTLTDDDFFLVAQGKLNPQMAFVQVI
jgi:3-hydroxyacyl-CoA dehydrogenase/3a,7a,12a-trihydroxy-5b-cholest-24-enoyl-CoA hydratase